MKAPPDRYSSVQKWLHWLMAALIAIMVGVGVTMTNLPDGPRKDFLYELHKSTGLTILALALLRIAVRLRRGAPPLVPDIPRWQRAAAHASHYSMYALFLLVPLAGWTATSSCCAPVNWFWTVPLTLPIPLPGDEWFWKGVFKVHYALAFTLATIVLVHATAALQHHFIRRDRTLLRMLPEGE